MASTLVSPEVGLTFTSAAQPGLRVYLALDSSVSDFSQLNLDVEANTVVCIGKIKQIATYQPQCPIFYKIWASQLVEVERLKEVRQELIQRFQQLSSAKQVRQLAKLSPYRYDAQIAPEAIKRP